MWQQHSQQPGAALSVCSRDSSWTRETGVGWNFSTLHFRLYLRGASTASGGLTKAQGALAALPSMGSVLCPLLERLSNEGEGKESSLRSSLDFSVGIINPGLQQLITPESELGEWTSQVMAFFPEGQWVLF